MSKRNVRLAKRKGYTFYVGPELEYFYLKAPDIPDVLDEGGYFDITPAELITAIITDQGVLEAPYSRSIARLLKPEV